MNIELFDRSIVFVVIALLFLGMRSKPLRGWRDYSMEEIKEIYAQQEKERKEMRQKKMKQRKMTRLMEARRVYKRQVQEGAEINGVHESFPVTKPKELTSVPWLSTDVPTAMLKYIRNDSYEEETAQYEYQQWVLEQEEKERARKRQEEDNEPQQQPARYSDSDSDSDDS